MWGRRRKQQEAIEVEVQKGSQSKESCGGQQEAIEVEALGIGFDMGSLEIDRC